MVQLLHMAAHRLWERRTRRAFVHAPAFVLALLCGGSVAATQAQWREHIHNVGIDVSPTQPSRLPPSRKQLLFNHNPKAGGSTLRKLLMKAVSNETFTLVRESGASGLAEQQRAFVIGNVREPCEHYVSLWAFNSKGRGSFAHSADNATLGRDPPHYNSPGDVHRFQTWLRLKKVTGVVTRRFLSSSAGRLAIRSPSARRQLRSRDSTSSHSSKSQLAAQDALSLSASTLQCASCCVWISPEKLSEAAEYRVIQLSCSRKAERSSEWRSLKLGDHMLDASSW